MCMYCTFFISVYFDFFKHFQTTCTPVCGCMIARLPGLGKQSQKVTLRLGGEYYNEFIMFSQSCGAKLEF